MDTINAPIASEEYLDGMLEAESLQTLRDLCVEYFRTISDGKTYKRRPPLALRLPHDYMICVIKPTIADHYGVVTVDQRGVIIECLAEGKATWLTVFLETDKVRKMRWMCDVSLSIEAAEALLETAENFVDDPCAVIARNKNNCGCCGKRLTDEVSRARGIGPECLGRFNSFFASA